MIVDFSGKFLNIDTAKEGDIVEIIQEGSYVDKDFEGKKSKALDIPVRNNGKELIYSPKMEAGKKLVKAFGNDTAKWIGKKFQVHIIRTKQFGNVKEQIDIEPIVSVKA